MEKSKIESNLYRAGFIIGMLALALAFMALFSSCSNPHGDQVGVNSGPVYYRAVNHDFDGKTSMSPISYLLYKEPPSSSAPGSNARTSVVAPDWVETFDSLSSRSDLLNEPVHCWKEFIGCDVKNYNSGKALRFSQGNGDPYRVTTRNFNFNQGDTFSFEYDHKSGSADLFVTIQGVAVSDTISLSGATVGTMAVTIPFDATEAPVTIHWNRAVGGNNGPMFLDSMSVSSTNQFITDTTPCTSLPVTWLDSFVARDQGCNIFVFEVADQVDVAYYEILYSKNAIEWESVGFIEPKEFQGGSYSYSFRHCIKK